MGSSMFSADRNVVLAGIISEKEFLHFCEFSNLTLVIGGVKRVDTRFLFEELNKAFSVKDLLPGSPPVNSFK